MKHDSLLDTLLEIQGLDRVPRMGFALRGVPDPESVAEHSFHVAVLVWALAPKEPHVDPARALELALLHDLAEVRTGDLPMTAGHYLGSGVKAAAERQALEELLIPAGPRAGSLASEIEARETTEARFVKACDKLHLMLKVTAYEQAGTGNLGEFWDNEANYPSNEFGSVAELFGELKERRTSFARP